jgi:hypothetical protein
MALRVAGVSVIDAAFAVGDEDAHVTLRIKY